MVDSKKLKEAINAQDMFGFLEYIGAEPQFINSNLIESRTVCHNGAHCGKRKLVYYCDTHSFYCYTECGSMDIFNIVMKHMGVDDFGESVRFVMTYFGISASAVSDFVGMDDFSFIKKFQKEPTSSIEYEPVDEKVLERYYPYFPKVWEEEGISPFLRKKYSTHFSIVENKIIIPHRDIKGNVIGIRGRALNQEEIDMGRKYMPVTIDNHVYRHLVGGNLYGLYENLEMIKKLKTVVIFEAEKSVQMLNTFAPEFSVGVAVGGSSFTREQAKLIMDLDVENVIIALDKEFVKLGDEDDLYHRKKVRKVFGEKLMAKCNVSILWDLKGDLDLKDSPTDKGKKVFDKMMANRIYLT